MMTSGTSWEGFSYDGMSDVFLLDVFTSLCYMSHLFPRPRVVRIFISCRSATSTSSGAGSLSKTARAKPPQVQHGYLAS